MENEEKYLSIFLKEGLRFLKEIGLRKPKGVYKCKSYFSKTSKVAGFVSINEKIIFLNKTQILDDYANFGLDAKIRDKIESFFESKKNLDKMNKLFEESLESWFERYKEGNKTNCIPLSIIIYELIFAVFEENIKNQTQYSDESTDEYIEERFVNKIVGNLFACTIRNHFFRELKNEQQIYEINSLIIKYLASDRTTMYFKSTRPIEYLLKIKKIFEKKIRKKEQKQLINLLNKSKVKNMYVY